MHVHAAPMGRNGAIAAAISIAAVAGALFFASRLDIGPTDGDTAAVDPAAVVRIVETGDRPREADSLGTTQRFQQVEAVLLDGPMSGSKVTFLAGTLELAEERSLLRVGDRIFLSPGEDPSDLSGYVFFGPDRRGPVFLMLALLVAAVIAVSRMRGVRALLGLVLSYAVITGFVVPYVVHGANLIAISMVGALLIIGPTYLLSYGATKKTVVALVATAGALAVSVAAAMAFSELARLTGTSDEGAFVFASWIGRGGEWLYQLLLAGMIIGALGVLDDVVIAQISTVFELAEADPGLSRRELFARAMRVGNDHIASVVNTLVLAYAGASLPVFLYFVSSHRPAALLVSEESIATEIVRTFAGTVSLVLAVPLATAVAAAVSVPAGPPRLVR